MSKFLKPSLDWLLIFLPLTIWFEYFAHGSPTVIFLCACLSIVPLAGWLGRATEQLAEHTSEGVGGLLNATFGNAAELIIAIMALRQGLHEVVKASLTGSIIGNVLLVLGAAFVGGGLRFKSQRFSELGARTQATMLILAAIGLIMPGVFHHIGGSAFIEREHDLSFDISIVLLITYALGLLFSLHTHKELFSGSAPAEEEGGVEGHWSLTTSLGLLAVATAFVAWMSEILVGSVEGAAHALGMSNIFIGVIVVAIIGNAAEHSTAVLVAMKDRMDLGLGIAFGSSIQIALFVAPVLVLASYAIAPHPLDLIFSPVELFAIGLSVLIAGQIASDGESNWFEGAQLLAVYFILGLVFYFLPESLGHVKPAGHAG